MFKKISIVLLILFTLFCFVDSTSASLYVTKDTGNTYINYQNGNGVSIFKIDDDGLLLNYRISTSTIAGASIDFGAAYAYGEAIELKYKVTDWTLIGSSFKALYLRSEATLGGSVGLRCAEFYAVMNTSTTTGLSSLQNIYAEMLIKAGGTRTLGGSSVCIEANTSIENQTALTLTNNVYCLFAKIQHGSGIANYTRLNGIKIAGRGDAAHVLGIALDISDTDTVASTWTTGISITTPCVTAIYISPTSVSHGLLMGAPSATAGSGLRIGTAYDAGGAIVGIYFDDGGVALASWGEGFTVGLVTTGVATGVAGMPYTGFFYVDMRANAHGPATEGWSTVMMNFAVANASTLGGFNVGVTALHASVDVNPSCVLHPETTLSCISFGGNWTAGTYDASSSGLVVPLNVRSTNQNWSALLHLPASPNGCYQAYNAAGTGAYSIRVYVGSTITYIHTYDAP